MIDEAVKKAFGLKGDGVPLKGGQNNSVLCGDIVIKKDYADIKQYEVTARILSALNSPHYRVARPVISIYSNYVESGYTATRFEEGAHDFTKLSQTLELSKIFHKDLSKFDINLYHKANDPWSVAMDILFRKREIPSYADKESMLIISELMDKLDSPNDNLQIIHGDFGGNVLYHPTLPPCIIDFSPNIAPSKMAEAIVFADSVAWNNTDLEFVNYLKPLDEYKVYLLYACTFRMLTQTVRKDFSTMAFFSEYNAYKKVWDYII